MNNEIQKWQWWNLWGKDKIKMTKKQKQSNEDRINQQTNQPTMIGNDHIQNRTKTWKSERKQGNNRNWWKTGENWWKWLEKMGIENS